MQKSFLRVLLAFVFGLLATSCVTTHQTNYLQEPKNFIPAYNDSVAYQEYILKPGDRLYILVYSMDEKTNALFNGASNSNSQILRSSTSENTDLYTYMVQTNGKINFPVVGEIEVTGKTLRETKVILENAIRPVLSINSVDVRLVGRSFSIIGAGKSGRYSFPKEKINIFQALAVAGDLGFYADRSRIRILRETSNGTQIKTFDIRSVDIINSEFYYIEPNDVIFVQPLKEQFFGVSTFWMAISTIVTTYSFGLIVYKTLF